MSIKSINLGSDNGNWHGGKTITNRGYKKILSKGHPRGDRDGYVLEHILVMEGFVERYLTDGEEVHHIDGDKLNNKIENLRLFSSHTEHLNVGHDNGRTGSIVTCHTCGKPFYKRKCRIERSKTHFCSQACVRPFWFWKRGGGRGYGR